MGLIMVEFGGGERDERERGALGFLVDGYGLNWVGFRFYFILIGYVTSYTYL
jgi:hypothetical protein